MSEPINVAYEAREIATRVAQDLAAREQLHDERHIRLQEAVQDVKESMNEIKKILTYAGGVLISLIISVLGWSLVQQYNANEAQSKALQEQVLKLQQDVRKK